MTALAQKTDVHTECTGAPLSIFFLRKGNENHASVSSTQARQLATYLGFASNRSARAGASPPVWHQVTWLAGSTSEAANDVAHAAASNRVQLGSHIKATGTRMNDGTS